MNARSVSSPMTTWLAPQASTSKVLSGVCAPASTMMAPAKPVSSCASSRSSGALDRAALDRVEVGDIAGRRAQPGAEGPQQRDRLADRLRREGGRRGLVARAVARLRPHGDAAREIEHRNDVHGVQHTSDGSPMTRRGDPGARLGHRRRQHQGRRG